MVYQWPSRPTGTVKMEKLTSRLACWSTMLSRENSILISMIEKSFYKALKIASTSSWVFTLLFEERILCCFLLKWQRHMLYQCCYWWSDYLNLKLDEQDYTRLNHIINYSSKLVSALLELWLVTKILHIPSHRNKRKRVNMQMKVATPMNPIIVHIVFLRRLLPIRPRIWEQLT